MEYLQITGRAKKFCLLYALLLCSVQVVFAAISPFTGSIFYITDNGYQRGPLFLISQFVPLLCYMLFMALVIIYRKKLRVREVVFFLLYIFIPLGQRRSSDGHARDRRGQRGCHRCHPGHPHERTV